jgi:S1-C subfamily serine protease
MIAWILAGIFGAGFMLLLGAFGMYLYMDGRSASEIQANASGTVAANSTPEIDRETRNQHSESKSSFDDDMEETGRLTEGQGNVVAEKQTANHSVESTIASDSDEPAAQGTSEPDVELSRLPALKEMERIELGEGETGLEYDWNDEKLVYSFRLNVNPRRRDQESFSGRTTFTPSDRDPEDLLNEEAIQESTGTGFLIHPDGLIMTCAHVVDETESVKVTVGEEIRVAKVIATDPTNDLALLRIDGNNLPYLPIADSRSVAQGSKVRVFGFPLTELLGESIKITNGFITGFSDNGSDIQIDATVNPGNSGGPVIDGNGQVIGVASQLLDGEGISSVGLAVGAGSIEAFLDRCELPFLSGGDKQITLEDIKNSVVFIRSDGATVNREKSKAISFQSHYYGNSRGIGNQNQDERGTIVVDSRGNVAMQNEEPKTLPVIIQEICQIGIEQLPKIAGQKSWTDSQTFFLTSTQTEREEREDPFGMRGMFPRGMPRDFGGRAFRGRNPLDPFGREDEVVREKTVTSVATLTQRFRLKSENDKEAVYTKTYEIETVKAGDRGFDVGLEYTGEFVFDKVEQRLSRGKFKGVATVKNGDESSRVPFEYNYDWVSIEQLKKEADDRLARNKAEAERKKRVDAVNSKRLDLYDPER